MMAGLYFMKKPPFKNIVIHGIVRDAQGRKMSKSLGNSLDPLELIEAYSADALRFSLALITSLDCDTKVDKSKFEIGRNFCTKIWNAARFIQMQEEALGGPQTAVKPSTSDEKHMLLACEKACAKMKELLEKYRIQDGALAVYDFFWTQICDWYVEYAKDAADKATAFGILRDVFWKALRLLHPYMPFVTEEVAHAGLLNNPNFFRTIYQISGIWEGAGYDSIVYFAAIIAISPTSYEAAQIDGAGKMAQMRYVVLPAILSTIVIMLITRIGSLLSVGYEKVLLLYNPNTYITAEVVSTFAQRYGIEQGQQGIASAAEIFA